jgi:ABC-type cobalamin/Fe3+-siderophores transport system ATPase subunit
LVATLSGGERQRVLLASCLAQQPELFLLDEPSTHLDLDQQLHCFSLMAEQCASGASCLAVTHDLNLALSYGTRLIVLADGAVAWDMTIEEATRSAEWLRLFSNRLALTTTPAGRPWVAYS